MKVEIMCISNFYDLEAKTDRHIGDTWIVKRERADYLVEDRKLCKVVQIIKTEKEKATVKTRKEKAVK